PLLGQTRADSTTGRPPHVALAGVAAVLAAALEVSILHMQVGVTHAATLDAHYYLGAARFWTVDDGLGERRPVGGERLADQLRHGDIVSIAQVIASAAPVPGRRSRQSEFPRRGRWAGHRLLRAAAMDRRQVS